MKLREGQPSSHPVLKPRRKGDEVRYRQQKPLRIPSCQSAFPEYTDNDQTEVDRLGHNTAEGGVGQLRCAGSDLPSLLHADEGSEIRDWSLERTGRLDRNAWTRNPDA